ncbi:uncharacterized protein LOC128888648 [Hylaeus anthracinus]|uniref:uncharacterized protein LOC128888648 n=1 Tax=Hylaeus anthracinus TaxID=313031 RepID=UPI0023B8CD19|nr:uncharacterized protein LOC128888648 [Hylaeus anthracinus]
MVSWVVGITGMWGWLILQRLLYCCVWTYWSYGSEYRDISYQWWQQVWSSYYPPPFEPPVMSAGFISWIISMSIAVMTLGCAISASLMWNFIVDSAGELRDTFALAKCSSILYLKRLLSLTLIIIEGNIAFDSLIIN